MVELSLNFRLAAGQALGSTSCSLLIIATLRAESIEINQTGSSAANLAETVDYNASFIFGGAPRQELRGFQAEPKTVREWWAARNLLLAGGP
jgi:hypothetical protein